MAHVMASDPYDQNIRGFQACPMPTPEKVLWVCIRRDIATDKLPRKFKILDHMNVRRLASGCGVTYGCSMKNKDNLVSCQHFWVQLLKTKTKVANKNRGTGRHPRTSVSEEVRVKCA